MVLTYLSFALSILASLCYSVSSLNAAYVVAGGVLFASAGLLDALDGELARAQGRESGRGAFLDSVLDKASEAAVAVGIVYSALASGIAVVAFLASSLLVSYSRARAEQLGVGLAGVGIAERAERILILFLASLLYPLVPMSLEYGLIALTILSGITVIQRVMYTYRRL